MTTDREKTEVIQTAGSSGYLQKITRISAAMSTSQPGYGYNHQTYPPSASGNQTSGPEPSRHSLDPEAVHEPYSRKSVSTPLPYDPNNAASPKSNRRRKSYNLNPQEYAADEPKISVDAGATRPQSRATFFSRFQSNPNDNKYDEKNQYQITNAPNTRYIYDRATNVKLKLINEVLQKPFFITPTFLQNTLQIPPDAFTISTLIQVFQIFIQIGIVCLCSQSMKNDDTQISHSIWAYLIAQSSIILAISTFFTLRVLHLGQNGTVFYSLVCTALTFAAFGLVLANLMKPDCDNTVVYCRLRKATTGLVSLSTFIWLSELVIFLTIVYVSRLDIIPDPKEEEAPAFVPVRQFSTATTYPPPNTADTAVAPQAFGVPENVPPIPEKVKKFIVSETGLKEVTDESELAGKEVVQIYTAIGDHNDSS